MEQVYSCIKCVEQVHFDDGSGVEQVVRASFCKFNNYNQSLFLD